MSGERVEFRAGESIESAAAGLCEAAEAHGEATGSFNGIELHAARGYAAAAVVSFYNDEARRRTEAWKNSPEGIAAAAERERVRSDLQAKHDALMRRLPQLDFTDQCAVLDWLCEMQGPSDHGGVIVRRKTILEAFAKRNFLPGVNCDADFHPEVRDNVHRWLVGQALSGLEEGPAIHGVIHKFAAEWKAKFVRHMEPTR